MTDHNFTVWLVTLISIIATWELIVLVLWIVGRKYNKKEVK